MTASQLMFAGLALSGCATADSSSPRYDEVAQAIGADVAGTGHAMADLVVLARGDMPSGFTRDDIGFAHVTRDGVRFDLLVTGDTALANWSGPGVRHSATLALHGPFVTGASFAEQSGLEVDATQTLLVDPDTLAIGGTILYTSELPATVTFDSDHPRIDFDADHAYVVDLATGEVSAATQIE
jgi:hypothetical protein